MLLLVAPRAPSAAKVGRSPSLLSVRPVSVVTAATLACWIGMADAQAQVQTFTLKRGSNVGPATKVVPANCVTNPTDGSVTCDTKVENPPGDTPAKPSYNNFRN